MIHMYYLLLLTMLKHQHNLAVVKLKSLFLSMKISKVVKNLLLKVIQKHVKLVFLELWQILKIICGLLKMKMLELGLNINLNLIIKLAKLFSKIEMMLKIKHLSSHLNLKINLNKHLILKN